METKTILKHLAFGCPTACMNLCLRTIRRLWMAAAKEINDEIEKELYGR